MKKIPAFALALSLGLTACGSSTIKQSANLEQQLKNPLFAERYYEDLVDTMVNIEIAEPDAAKEQNSLIVKTKDEALAKAKDQTRLRREGKAGQFVAVKAQPEGWALLHGSDLYLSTDFITEPGPSLHLYLTRAVDPRDVTFPEATTIDIGLLESPYGAQAYAVPVKDEDLNLYSTAVLYDTELKRIYGFVQLAK